MLLYHASPVPGLTKLRPFVSNHGTSCVYLSEKRENTLVYLSNAVEKYCRETGFLHSGIWQKWASYGFTKNGLLCLDEYYANATFETYCGVQGYIYAVEDAPGIEQMQDIPFGRIARTPLKVVGTERVEDAFAALRQAEEQGKLLLRRYADLTKPERDWLRDTISEEYQSAESHPEYRHFLRGKLSEYLKDR